jgi:hypothetical protein
MTTTDRIAELTFNELADALEAQEGHEVQVDVGVEHSMSAVDVLGAHGTLRRDRRLDDPVRDRQMREVGGDCLHFNLMCNGRTVGDFHVDQMSVTSAHLRALTHSPDYTDSFTLDMVLDVMRMSEEEPHDLPPHRLVLSVGWGGFFTGAKAN